VEPQRVPRFSREPVEIWRTSCELGQVCELRISSCLGFGCVDASGSVLGPFVWWSLELGDLACYEVVMRGEGLADKCRSAWNKEHWRPCGY
jgi:hypothetical protein